MSWPIEGPMQSFVASDGVKLSYKRMGSGVPLIMLHGWSASHRSFDLNAKAIATYCCELVMPDLRFHGESDKPDWGFHVARLAADLRELLAEIGFHRPACVGCSLGAAIIWSFCELYGCELLGRVCFVDQAPCQWRLPDWSFCSKGIYDEASLANITAALQAGMSTFADGNAECCLTKRVPPSLLATLKAETERCNPTHLAQLMRDHAQLDWRPILPRITIPVLNVYGSLSGCFPEEGLATIGQLIPHTTTVVFSKCNHWLYMEEPGRFNDLICKFCSELF